MLIADRYRGLDVILEETRERQHPGFVIPFHNARWFPNRAGPARVPLLRIKT